VKRDFCAGDALLRFASASVLTEKMKGGRFGELRRCHAAEIAAELGGLPPASFHAAQLAEDGVKAILQNI